MTNSLSAPSPTQKLPSTKTKLSACRELILFDQEKDLASAYLEGHILEIYRAASKTRVQTERLRRSAMLLVAEMEKLLPFKARVALAESFEAEAKALEAEYLKELQARKNAAGSIDEGESTEPDRLTDAASEEIEELKIEDPEADLSDLKKKVQAKREAKIKNLHRKLTKLCHPDKSGGDKVLEDMFPLIDEAYKQKNLGMLKALLQDVENYLKARTSNKYRKTVLLASKAKAEQDLMEAKEALALLKGSPLGELLTIKKEGNEQKLHRAFSVFLNLWTDGARDKMNVARMRLETLRSPPAPPPSSGSFTWTAWSSGSY